jgi:hypothetical protein
LSWKTKPKGMRTSTHPKWQPPPGQLRHHIVLIAEKIFHRPVPQNPRRPSEASTKTGIRNDTVPGFKSL